MMVSLKPSVFVGSSVESLPVLNAVVRLLRPFAEVTAWTESDKFKQVGAFFLDSLIAASGLFDFAVLVFGPDDVVHSRELVQQAPRDNVVFELGLFLSKLGRTRTFVIAPRVWQTGLKILSDLHGLNLAEYDAPEREKDLERRLKESCKGIGRRMQELRSRQVPRGPRGVTDVRRPLEELIMVARALNTPVSIRNIALDMEVTWPLVRDMLLLPEDTEDVTWQSLMIDRHDEAIQLHSSGTVSTKVALDVEEKIKEFYDKNKVEIERRNIRFECKTYSALPTMHGFLFNGSVLFFSLCGFKDGKLVGAPNPYIKLEGPRKPSSDEAAAHFIEAFEDWFSYHWERGRTVWPR
jgi:hypothetical protein